ncbi:MAG TPA: phosphoribosylanthranilate isomerase [Ectothiorhodospiraceae bacterium]|nr:phosphoribosylanthranilate isomerase [Ectothiorhodospiraceae bacterium]
MNYRTRIKICGITRAKDGVEAVQLGADAIGLVFYPPSPRFVAIEQAKLIIQALPPFVTTVGLFVNAERREVEEVLQNIPLSLLQFHGDEDAVYCDSFDKRYIKAVSMKEGIDLHKVVARYSTASGLLVDAYHPDIPGGTGLRFDWNRIPKDLSLPLILAGGLSADSIKKAVLTVSPYAVDVSSGVEASKGIKDSVKMSQFIRGVTLADEQLSYN